MLTDSPLLLDTRDLSDMSTYHILLNSTLVELRSLYFRLCEDPRLLVRREAAKQLARCMQAFGPACYPRCLAQLQRFLRDDVSIESSYH